MKAYTKDILYLELSVEEVEALSKEFKRAQDFVSLDIKEFFKVIPVVEKLLETYLKTISEAKKQ